MGKGKYLKKAKVSTGKKVLRVVLVILLVLVLLVGAVFAFVWSKLGKITYVPGNPQETVANVETIPPVENPTEAYVPDETVIATEAPAATEGNTEETAPDEIVDMGDLTLQEAPAYSSGDLFKDKNVMNILLVGTDERTEGFVQSSRGDVNILVSINKSENTVKLVSFSRGIAIKMLDGPYAGKYEWLTNAHRWAGHEAVTQAMSEAFKIELDRYVRINFTTVESVVDAVGGIEMELTAAEVKKMSEDRLKWGLKEGTNHLTGEMALRYARLRKVDDDWGRMSRQRRCIMAVIDKLQGASFSTLNDLCDMVMPMIQTNLTKREIAELILYSPKFITSEFDQMTIPIENSYGGMTVMSGAGGWALDYEKNNKVLHEFLFGIGAE